MEEKLDKIIELLDIIAKNTCTYNGYAKWTYEQEELVDIMYNEGHDLKEIIIALKERFDVDRTVGAITSRMSRLGLGGQIKKSNLKKDLLPEEIIIDSIYNDPKTPPF